MYMPHSLGEEPCQGAPQATSGASLPLMRLLVEAICCGRKVAKDKQAGDPSIILAVAPSESVLTLMASTEERGGYSAVTVWRSVVAQIRPDIRLRPTPAGVVLPPHLMTCGAVP